MLGSSQNAKFQDRISNITPTSLIHYWYVNRDSRRSPSFRDKCTVQHTEYNSCASSARGLLWRRIVETGVDEDDAKLLLKLQDDTGLLWPEDNGETASGQLLLFVSVGVATRTVCCCCCRRWPICFLLRTPVANNVEINRAEATPHVAHRSRLKYGKYRETAAALHRT